jgi:hypothetical protein
MANTYTQMHIQYVIAVKYCQALIQKEWKERLHQGIAPMGRKIVLFAFFSTNVLPRWDIDDIYKLYLFILPTFSLPTFGSYGAVHYRYIFATQLTNFCRHRHQTPTIPSGSNAGRPERNKLFRAVGTKPAHANFISTICLSRFFAIGLVLIPNHIPYPGSGLPGVRYPHKNVPYL